MKEERIIEEAKKEQEENQQGNKALNIQDDDKSVRVSDAHLYNEEEDDCYQRTADKDDDIFWHIQNLVKYMPNNFIRITWMPAHLDEEKKQEEKRRVSQSRW